MGAGSFFTVCQGKYKGDKCAIKVFQSCAAPISGSISGRRKTRGNWHYSVCSQSWKFWGMSLQEWFTLHSEQIVHGDLTAVNILLNIKGTKVVAKVADFCQARVLDPDTLATSDQSLEGMTSCHPRWGILRTRWSWLEQLTSSPLVAWSPMWHPVCAQSHTQPARKVWAHGICSSYNVKILFLFFIVYV